MRRFILSKIDKSNALVRNKQLRKYVPETKVMSAAVLRNMLAKYQMVYVKPNIGTFGNGVIRVEQLVKNESSAAKEPSGSSIPTNPSNSAETTDPTNSNVSKDTHAYQFQSGLTRRSFSGFDPMYAQLSKLTRGRRYLAQQGIHLLRYHGRRFDLRVMVQQNAEGVWETTGIIGRVAAPKKIVTNYHNGGKLVPVEKLLASHAPSGSSRRNHIAKLSALGELIARQLQSVYPGLKEIGVDVALDSRLHPWVLEANTSPDPYIFRKLADKRIFAKIIRYRRRIDAKSRFGRRTRSLSFSENKM
jgi:glutathione synthase/RimK-type ligase-like ATP-grasp enzyme